MRRAAGASHLLAGLQCYTNPETDSSVCQFKAGLRRRGVYRFPSPKWAVLINPASPGSGRASVPLIGSMFGVGSLIQQRAEPTGCSSGSQAVG